MNEPTETGKSFLAKHSLAMFAVCFLMISSFMNFNQTWFYVQVFMVETGIESDRFGSAIVAPLAFLSLVNGDNLDNTTLYILSYVLFLVWMQIVVFRILPLITMLLLKSSLLSGFYLSGSTPNTFYKDMLICIFLIITPYVLIDFYALEYFFSGMDPISVSKDSASALWRAFGLVEWL